MHKDIINSDFYRELSKKILVVDGALGTAIQNYNLSESDFRGELYKDHGSDLKGNNDLLVLTQPDIVTEISESYLKAGAKVYGKPAYDHEFRCSDFLTILDIKSMSEKHRNKYMR